MPEPRSARNVDRSVVRVWGPDEPQRVWLDDAAQVIAAETGLRAVAADVPCSVHAMGGIIGTGLAWTTVVALPDRTPILSQEQQARIVSGDTDEFYRTCASVCDHIKSHPSLYFGSAASAIGG